MTFSINLLIILRKIISRKVLEVLYDELFSLGIIIDVDFLKWVGQMLRLMQELAMLTKFVMYLLSLINTFKWLHERWSESRVDKLLYLLVTSVNSALEKGGQFMFWWIRISFNS